MDVFRFAAQYEPHRGIRESGLDAHYRFALSPGLLRAVAEQAEHTRQMYAICGTLVLELIGQVVVAAGQSKSILGGLRDHHRGVRVVLGRREREQRLRAEKMQVRDQLSELLLVFKCRNAR